jgi:alkylation response protein AidB-like acyl-CoA dehydrogenase
VIELEESDDIVALRDTLRKFIAREFKPQDLREWDRKDLIPREISRKLGALGLCGLCVPEEYGGMGRQVIAMSVVLEELARCTNALATLYYMAAGYGGLNIAESGTEEQKRRLLPGLVAGEILFAYGLSEPDIGADLADVKTRAERRVGTGGDRVIVNGTKRWTTGAGIADYIYTLVRSGKPEERRKNLSFVLIPANARGVTIKRIEAMGAKGVQTNDVLLQDVEVPFDNVIKGEAGWNNAWSILAGPSLEIEKLGPSAIALGIAEGAVAEAWEYSQQRIQGGKHICGHQAVRHVLSDVQTRLQACRLMTRHAAWLVEQRQPSAVATSMAKLFVTEQARDIVLACQQYVMGAYGYAEGFNMERYVRDILLMPIIGGSAAIQRNNVANLMKLPRE